MTPLERQALHDQIRTVLSDSLGSDHNVLAVYLFGSALEGPYRPSSDIDPEARIEYEVGRKGLYYDFKPFLEKLRSEKA